MANDSSREIWRKHSVQGRWERSDVGTSGSGAKQERGVDAAVVFTAPRQKQYFRG